VAAGFKVSDKVEDKVHGYLIHPVNACTLRCLAHRRDVMRYRPLLALALGTVVITIIVFSFLPSKRGLVVQGKPVSDWAMALLGPAPTEPAQAVFKSLGPEAVSDLVDMLRTKDSLLKQPVSAMASALPPRLGVKVQHFFGLNEPVQRRIGAVTALRLMGTNAVPAIPALLDALHDRDVRVSMSAAMVLGQVAPDSLTGLIATLDDSKTSARHAAMTGLTQIGFRTAPAVPKLVSLLRSSTDRARARLALEAIGKPAVPSLIELLDDSSEEMRLEAIGTLGTIGALARAAIPALTTLVQDRSQNVRYQTLNSLALICRSCDPVVSVLQSALGDESWDVRRIAATHLSQNPRVAQATVDMLREKLERGTAADKEMAIVNLGFMGAAAEPALAPLRNVSAAENATVRELAREASRRIESGIKNTRSSAPEPRH